MDSATSLGSTVNVLASHRDRIVEKTFERLHHDLPTYDRVPRDVLAAAIDSNLAIAEQVLRTGHVRVAPGALADIERRLERRIAQGLAIQDVLQGIRASVRVIQEQFAHIASEEGVPSDEVLKATSLLWSLSDVLAAHQAVAWQRRGLDELVRESHRRTDFVRTLLSGVLENDWEASASAYGLDPRAEFFAVKATPGEGASTVALQRSLESTFREGALVGVVGETCVGLVPARPRVPEGALVALGPSTQLAAVRQSFDVAVRVHDWMERRGRRGLATLDHVSWRLGVDREEAVSLRLRARYVDPLQDLGEFGVFLFETLDMYLGCNRNVMRTAAALVIHPNTLRYRLAKYQQLTGCDLDSTDDVIELAWALETRAIS